MTQTARAFFGTFAVVGLASGLLAGWLLWLIITRPLLLAQTVAGLP